MFVSLAVVELVGIWGIIQAYSEEPSTQTSWYFSNWKFTLHCSICSSCGELMPAALHCRCMRSLCVFSDGGRLAVFVHLDGVRPPPSASGIRFIPDGIVFSTIALTQKANKRSAKRSE